MISYMLVKNELTYLFQLISGGKNGLPQSFSEYVPEKEKEKIIQSLIEKGIAFKKPAGIDVEQTIGFLIYQLSCAERAAVADSGKVYVYYCPELIIILESDRLNASRCRITPVKDEASLEAHLSECEISIGKEINIKESGEL